MSALMLKTLVVGCAARFLPGRDVVVAAVACRDGGHAETIPAAELAGSAVAAQAVAAILGLELATSLGYQSITLMLTGRLTLCARLRTRAPVPELGTGWNERLRRALAPVRELSTISNSPDTTGTLQATATARCEALAAAAAPTTPSADGSEPW